MKLELENFLNQFPYPPEAKTILLQELDRILSNTEAARLLLSPIEAYQNDVSIDFEAAMQNAAAAGAAAGVHEYTARFLFYACLAEPLRLQYMKKGIPLSVWYDTMMDLIYKLEECHTVYGIWGTFVGHWLGGFFNMTRFALGRLEFETTAFYLADAYSSQEIKLQYGEGKLLNIHIPSGRPLKYEDVLDSYRQAYRFYSSRVEKGLLPMVCSSWLLYDGLEEFLPNDSNILRFKRDFKILKNTEAPDFHDCWRIFHVPYTGDPAVLPRNTSLQRGYADWIAAGGIPGTGAGILLFDGEKVIR